MKSFCKSWWLCGKHEHISSPLVPYLIFRQICFVRGKMRAAGILFLVKILYSFIMFRKFFLSKCSNILNCLQHRPFVICWTNEDEYIKEKLRKCSKTSFFNISIMLFLISLCCGVLFLNLSKLNRGFHTHVF